MSASAVLQRPFGLADEVFFCVTQGQGIFLDLKRDVYSAIPVPSMEQGSEPSDQDIEAALEAHVEELMSAGLIAANSTPGRSTAAFRSIGRPVQHIFGQDDQRAFGLPAVLGISAAFTMRDVIRFVTASHRASESLRTRHIADIVREVARRKGSPRQIDSAAEIRRQTAIFRRLRPWYPRPYLCLFEALALLEFLDGVGLHPDWVFGVQANPFGAHCWVQVDDILLNEGSEYAGQFRPIMIV